MPAKLELITSHYTRDAAGLLTDGLAHIRFSANVSRLKLLGAIEQAKHHILNAE